MVHRLLFKQLFCKLCLLHFPVFLILPLNSLTLPLENRFLYSGKPPNIPRRKSIMSSEYHLLFIPSLVQYSSTLSYFEALAFTLLFMAIFGLWLAPGGLAWALSKVKTRLTIPGPHGFPATGLLNVFTESTPHRVLAELARRFNALPLMAFSVGFTRFVIASQPETAKEVLNSSSFADRPIKESAYELLFHRAMGFAPYGEYWRNLRRISATHLFSPKRIGDFEGFRCKTGLKMVEEVKGLMVEKGEVEVRKVLHFGSMNNVMMTVFGQYYNEFSEGGDGHELEKMVSEGYELLGIFNWSDHFPLLGWFDFQGVRKRGKSLVAKVNAFVRKIIEEHRLKRVIGQETFGDFVDVLLDLDKGNKLRDSDMIAVLWVLIHFFY